MESLGTQFRNLMDRRFAKVVPDAAVPLTNDIFKQTVEATRIGVMPFSGTGMRYDSPYMKKYAKYRQKVGRQTEMVDLRLKSRHIEQSVRFDTPNYAEIGFANGGRIFKYHHDGISYKNGNFRQRTLFPKSWLNVPQPMYTKFIKRIVRIMNGK
jgi:hypothetical protein